MPSLPIFGIVPQTSDTEASPAILADLDTVGLIGPAPNADATMFPLDTPVMFNSDDVATISRIGTAGFIADAISGVNDQLADFERAAQIVFVRTAPGADGNPSIALKQTLANIMGSSTTQTGLFAFLKAAAMVKAIPRLLMAPGYTGQLYNGLASVFMSTPGAGYVPGDSYPIVFSSGGANAVQATAHVVANGDGTLGTPVIDSYGAFYDSAPAAVIAAPPSGGTQALFSASIALNADPVCASFPPVLNALLGCAIVESAGTSQAADNAWRQTLNSSRLIPLSGGVKIVDAAGDIVVMPAAPRMVGIMIRRDFETGAPFHSAANQPVQGIIGPARVMSFNITDGANEGQELLTNNIGIIVDGELGNDFAIASGGYILISTDNASSDSLWQFYNVQRGRDFINITLVRTLRFYLGRYNITAQTIQVVTNAMENLLSYLRGNDNLLGYKLSFSGKLNTADQIRQGNLSISFAAEEPTVLRRITAVGSRYRPAVDALIQQLEAQLAVVG